MGRDGICLNEEWEEKYPDTYKGATIHGFPNFFILLSAGVALGHSSVVVIIEWYVDKDFFIINLITTNSQVDYAIKCMKHALKKELIAIEPKLTAQKAYTNNLKGQFKGTVWETGCSSWYLNKDGEVSYIISFCMSLIKSQI